MKLLLTTFACLFAVAGCVTDQAAVMHDKYIPNVVLKGSEFGDTTPSIEEVDNSRYKAKFWKFSSGDKGMVVGIASTSFDKVWEFESRSSEAIVDTWKYFKNNEYTNLVRGQGLQTRLGMIDYATLNVLGRSCFAFEGNFDMHDTDDLYRPTKKLFGYFCQRGNDAISDLEVGYYLSQISLGETEKEKPIITKKFKKS